MKRKVLILFAALICFSPLYGSQEITLDYLYSQTVKNYPVARKLKLDAEISSMKYDNLTTKYYPEISLIGQAQYQSDVTKVSINIPLANGFAISPSIPEPTKDQYKIGVNINQTIWDGGLVSQQKDLEAIQGRVNRGNTESELYALRQRVNDAFFSVMLIQLRLSSLEVLISDLNEKLSSIRSIVNNGAMLESNADILEAELIKAGQNREDLNAARVTALGILSELTGVDLDTSMVFLEPENTRFDYASMKSSRPEYRVFSLARDQLDETKYLADARNMPKFSAYAQAMYAKPGLNMFDPDFAPFYIVGVRASWNLWDWNASGNEKQILELQKELIDIQEETFTKNINIASQKYRNDIARLDNLIESDNRIIRLRGKIAAQSYSQLVNGVITSTEYVAELNAKSQAELALEIHKLELIQARINLMTQMGYDIPDETNK